ncbi:MAG: hypothetical protein ACREX9_09880 [Gammaproteobacteria bacterium]
MVFFTFLSGVTLSLSSLALAPVLDFSYNMLSPALSPSYKIIADDGDLLFEIPELGRLDALALDRSGIFWAYSGGVLYSYSFSGESVSATLLPTPHDKDNEITAESAWGEGFEPQQDPFPSITVSYPVYLEPNPIDGSIWLARQQNLFHVDANGDLLDRIASTAIVNGLAFDTQRDRLYVATGRGIAVRNAFGKSALFANDLSTAVRDLAYDAESDALWVLEQNALTRYDAQTGQALLRISAKNELEKIAVIPAGGLWMATRTELIKLSDAGKEERRINFADRIPGREILALFIDPFDNSLWVAGENGLRQIGAQNTP